MAISSWASYKNRKVLRGARRWEDGKAGWQGLALPSTVGSSPTFSLRDQAQSQFPLFSWPRVRTQGEPGSVELVSSGIATSTNCPCDLEQNRDHFFLICKKDAR